MIIAGTGHRPHKLGGYSQDARKKLISLATTYLEVAKPDAVISGMAQGWDQALAIAALRLNIYLTAAVPFNGQDSRWPEESRKKFSGILARCNRVVYVSKGGYAPVKMQVRNEWMVDQLEGPDDHLVALWDGTSGGTGNCIRYALDKGHTIRNLWPIFTGKSDVYDLLL